MTSRMTEKDFIDRLSGTNKELLGEFAGWKQPITVKCLLCNSEPYTIKRAIAALTGKGCKKCASSRSIRVDKSEHIANISKLGYSIVGAFTKLYDPLTVQCNDCNTIKHLKHGNTIFIYPNKKCCNVKNAKYTTESLHSLLKDRGFLCDNEYTFLDDPIEILCMHCHKTYKIGTKHAIKKQCVCQKKSSRKYSLEEVHKISNSIGLKFLEDKMLSVEQYYNFECENGHINNKPFSEVIRTARFGNRRGKDSNGCKQCATERYLLPTEKVKQIYEGRGFVFKDEKYLGSTAKHLTQCKECLYTWKTSYACIGLQQSGCPKCNMFRNEKLTGKFLEQLLPNINICKQTLIQPAHTEFGVKNKIKQRKIKVDFSFIMNDVLFYVEYNGAQHYKPIVFVGQNKESAIASFERQQIRDEWLRKYCLYTNIKLIEIDGREYTEDSIKKFLENELNAHFAR